MEIFGPHLGLDWAATLLTLLSLWCLGNRRAVGFLLGVSANVGWGAFGARVDSVATVLANVACLALNLRGWLRWRAEARNPFSKVPDTGR